MFKDMRNLVQLWLVYCGIKNIAEDTFSSLKSLTYLDLRDNRIKKLNEKVFWSLENLEMLYLHGNQIEEIPVRLFKNIPKLKELDIHINKIKSIPFGLLDSLTELTGFSISSNELEVIHPNTFQQNKNLTTLWLGSNKISAIAGTTFAGITKLTWLNLTRNSCIDKQYGKWGSAVLINLDSVSSDLAVCARNYDNLLQDLMKKLENCYNSAVPNQTIINEETTPKEDCHCEVPKDYSTHLLIIIAVTSSFSVIGTIVMIIFIFKTKKVVKQKNEKVDMRLQENNGDHYYSTPDTPAQIEHARQAKQERLRRGLQQKLEGPYEEVNYNSMPYTTEHI
jgi:hypothetical protein